MSMPRSPARRSEYDRLLDWIAMLFELDDDDDVDDEDVIVVVDCFTDFVDDEEDDVAEKLELELLEKDELDEELCLTTAEPPV